MVSKLFNKISIVILFLLICVGALFLMQTSSQAEDCHTIDGKIVTSTNDTPVSHNGGTDYDKDNWFERVKGLEDEPERGARCTECFDMRFERSALFAKENNFGVYATTLGISRWKDMNQINASGTRSAERYDDVTYWDFNWRKQGGASRMIEISKREEFYQQEYCGCVYSLRDTNRWRQKNDKDRIIRGIKFYS